MSITYGLPKRHGTVALLLLSGLFVSALAESHDILSKRVLSVVFALDVSASMGSPDKAIAYITNTVKSHRAASTNDQQGMVIFGKSPAVELPPSNDFRLGTLQSQIDRNSTNLEAALQMSSELIKHDVQGRVVLISDGVQSEGNLTRVLPDLKSRRVAVDVLPIEHAYEHEVWLERLDLPQQVKLGETYEAAVILSSLSDGHGKLSLQESGNVIAVLDVDYRQGQNRFSVPITLRLAGDHEYTADIEVPEAQDSLTENNSIQNHIFAEGEGKVLLVTDSEAPESDWAGFANAIRSGERSVEVIAGSNLRREMAWLGFYDAIVFSNVPRNAFDFSQLQAVHHAVHDLGTGFLMVGGPNSFGPGGYHGTVIEEILPVSMDFKERKAALVIVLDRCGVRDDTWVKRVTKQAIQSLGPQDEVGVLAWTEIGENWLFELTPASKYEEVAPLIDGASIGSLQSFQSTMEMGLKGLMKSDAATRHMIIISAGDPLLPAPRLLKEFMEATISISMVVVFPEGGLENVIVKAIAEITGGRYYSGIVELDDVSTIFIKEAEILAKSSKGLRRMTFVPSVGVPSSVIEGLGDIPALGGYVTTTGKATPAAQILNGLPAGSGAYDPILSSWQYGRSKTAAFTSDLGMDWGAKWQKWDRFQTFVKQLMTDIGRVKNGHLRISTHASGGDVVIDVEDVHPEESRLTIQASLLGPTQKSETVALMQVDARHYQATVPIWGHGQYHVLVQGTSRDRRDLASCSLSVPLTCSPEYLRFGANWHTLQEIADRTGGRVLTGDPITDAVYSHNRSIKRTSLPTFDWFLIFLALMVPLDATLRGIAAEVVGIWKALIYPVPAPPTPTLVALLRTKQWVSAALSSKGTRRLLIHIWSPPPRRTLSEVPTTSSNPDASATSGAIPEETDLTTTTLEKLLTRKREHDDQT